MRQGSESCELSKIGHQGGKFNAASENMAPLLFVGSTNIYSEMYDDTRNSKDHGLKYKLTRQKQIIEASYGTLLYLPSLIQPIAMMPSIVLESRNRTSREKL